MVGEQECASESDALDYGLQKWVCCCQTPLFCPEVPGLQVPLLVLPGPPPAFSISILRWLPSKVLDGFKLAGCEIFSKSSLVSCDLHQLLMHARACDITMICLYATASRCIVIPYSSDHPQLGRTKCGQADQMEVSLGISNSEIHGLSHNS